MSNFSPNKLSSRTEIHNGVEYTINDSPSPTDFNKIINSLLYALGFSGTVDFGAATALKAKSITVQDAKVNGEMSAETVRVNYLMSGSQSSLAVQDNILVVNATPLDEAAGVVIIKEVDEEGYSHSAYGVLYMPTKNAICIGDVTVAEGSAEEGHTVIYDESTMMPIATRNGVFLTNELPMWDAASNSFVPSGKTIDDLGGGGITEGDYEITDPLKFTKLHLSQMSGNVLVKNCGTVGTGSEIDIPSSITTLKFINTKVDGILINEGNTTIIGYAPADNSTNTCAIRNFGKVENASGSAQIINCKHISNSELWVANNCSFISDCTTIVGAHDTYTAVFENCKHIHGISVLDRNSKVEFKGCSFISNVSSDLSADGIITYTNCTYVDALTCVGYGSGVPYIDASGVVTFLESAEGGSYGS